MNEELQHRLTANVHNLNRYKENNEQYTLNRFSEQNQKEVYKEEDG